MNALKGIIRNGQVVLERPTDWPDGTEVRIAPTATDQANGEEPGEEEWSNTPEAIAEWLAWSKSLKPLNITPEEEADTEAWLRKMSDYGWAKMEKRVEDLCR